MKKEILLKKTIGTILITILVSLLITCSAMAARKEIKDTFSSYSKLKKKIVYIHKTPDRDPLENKSHMLFMNSKGEDQGIIGRYEKKSGRVCLFQNRYRDDISCYGVYLGQSLNDAKKVLKKYGFKLKKMSKTDNSTYYAEYACGKKKINLWTYNDKKINCYQYVNY